MKNTTAAFITGDKNVIEPSYIVFKSLLDHNEDIDCFLCLPEHTYSDQQVKAIKELGVVLLDLVADTLFEDCLQWPKEIFLNFRIPNKLHQMGYKVGIKLDSDILITGNLNLDKNKPQEIFKSNLHAYDRFRDLILHYPSFYKEKFNITEQTFSKKFMMLGVLYVNLESYVAVDFWNKYRSIYQTIVQQSPDKSNASIFADMGVFILTIVHYDIAYEILEERYNYIVTSLRHLKSKKDLNFQPVAIHYAGPKKPWKKIAWIKYITNPYNLYYRQKYIDYVNPNKNKGLKSKFINSLFYLLYLKLHVFIRVS